jgi:hypothetical protein
MAGLDPAIHDFLPFTAEARLDARAEPGHDGSVRANKTHLRILATNFARVL